MLPSLPGLPFALPREGGCVSDLPWRGAGKVTVGRGEQRGHFLAFLSLPVPPLRSPRSGWGFVREGGGSGPGDLQSRGEWRWHIAVETGWPGRSSVICMCTPVHPLPRDCRRSWGLFCLGLENSPGTEFKSSPHPVRWKCPPTWLPVCQSAERSGAPRPPPSQLPPFLLCAGLARHVRGHGGRRKGQEPCPDSPARRLCVT